MGMLGARGGMEPVCFATGHDRPGPGLYRIVKFLETLTHRVLLREDR